MVKYNQLQAGHQITIDGLPCVVKEDSAGNLEAYIASGIHHDGLFRARENDWKIWSITSVVHVMRGVMKVAVGGNPIYPDFLQTNTIEFTNCYEKSTPINLEDACKEYRVEWDYDTDRHVYLQSYREYA